MKFKQLFKILFFASSFLINFHAIASQAPKKPNDQTSPEKKLPVAQSFNEGESFNDSGKAQEKELEQQVTEVTDMSKLTEDELLDLLKKEPIIIDRNNSNANLLMWACKKGFETIFDYALTTLHNDPTAHDNDGLTALHYAANFGHLNLVQRIVSEQLIDINCKNNKHETPLVTSLFANDPTVTKYLLDHGAGYQAQKALTRAKFISGSSLQVIHPKKERQDIVRDHKQIINYLEAVVALEEQQTKTSQSGESEVKKTKEDPKKVHPLTMQPNQIVNAIKAGIPIDLDAYVVPGTKTTMLMYACGASDNGGIEELCDLILQKGNRNLDVQDICGNTALHHAATCGHVGIMVKLIAAGASLDIPNNGLETPLFRAIYSTNLAAVQLLVKTKKINLNARAKNHMTPLMWAVCNNNPDVVQLLIDNKVDITAQMPKGYTALSLAKDPTIIASIEKAYASSKKLKNTPKGKIIVDNKIIQLHLEKAVAALKSNPGTSKGAKSALQATSQCPATDKAGHKDTKEIIEETENLLIPIRHALLKQLDSSNEVVLDEPFVKEGNVTHLVYATYRGDQEVVTALLKSQKNIEVNAKDTMGNTALHHAAFAGHCVMIEQLLAKGALLDEPNNEGQTPFTYAVTGRQLVAARKLLERGANRSAQINDGRTSLQQAILTNYPDMVEFLLENSREIFVESQLNEALKMAESMVNDDILFSMFPAVDKKILIENNKKIIEHIQKAMVEKYVMHNFGPKTKDTQQEDQLKAKPIFINHDDNAATIILAVRSEKPEKVAECLKHRKLKKQVNQKDMHGNTALNYAVLQRNEAMIKMLLDENADIECKDRDGDTPLFLAIRLGYAEIVKLLLERKANVRHVNTNKDTALMCAVRNSNPAIVDLIKDKVDVTLQNKHKKTALSIANDIANRDPDNQQAQEIYAQLLKLMPKSKSQLQLSAKKQKAKKQAQKEKVKPAKQESQQQESKQTNTQSNGDSPSGSNLSIDVDQPTENAPVSVPTPHGAQAKEIAQTSLKDQSAATAIMQENNEVIVPSPKNSQELKQQGEQSRKPTVDTRQESSGAVILPSPLHAQEDTPTVQQQDSNHTNRTSNSEGVINQAAFLADKKQEVENSEIERKKKKEAKLHEKIASLDRAIDACKYKLINQAHKLSHQEIDQIGTEIKNLEDEKAKIYDQFFNAETINVARSERRGAKYKLLVQKALELENEEHISKLERDYRVLTKLYAKWLAKNSPGYDTKLPILKNKIEAIKKQIEELKNHKKS
jgi:ankyrin repeat protein